MLQLPVREREQEMELFSAHCLPEARKKDTKHPGSQMIANWPDRAAHRQFLKEQLCCDGALLS